MRIQWNGDILAQMSASGTTLTVEAFASTGRIKLYMDGALKPDFTDPVTTRPRSGNVGIRMTNNGFCIDNFKLFAFNLQ